MSKVSRLLLYKRDASPPSCAVMMLGNILGLEFEYIEPNLLALEHKSPEFRKINPAGTIPVLQDGDISIYESHAIMHYLLNKYGGAHKEALYPSEARARAAVDQRLYYDAGVMFIRLKVVALPTILHGLVSPSEKDREDVEDSFSVLEAYLKETKYIAADHLTLADLSLGTTALAVQVIKELDANKYPRCADWMARLQQETFFKEIATPGIAVFSHLMTHYWEKNKEKASQ